MKLERWVNKSTCIVAEGETQADVFGQVAAMEEVFGESQCAKCRGEDLRFQVRKATKGKKEFLYHELICKNSQCRAKLSFGHGDGGVLFPIRYEREKNDEDVTVYAKDAEGKNIPRGTWGWTTYNRTTGKEE